MNWKVKQLRNGVLGSVFCGISVGVFALVSSGADFADALQRPAVQIAQAEKAVLLGAATSASGRIVAVGERGLVVLSDDGGVHWRQAPTPVSVTLTAVRFGADQRGVAVGHGGVVLTSTDNGESWIQRLDGVSVAQLAAAEAEASGDELMQESARLLRDEGPDKPLLDVHLGEAGELLAVGAYGLAFSSSDFGQTWTSWMGRLDNPDGMHLYSVRQHGQVIVIVGERGLVLRSTDGGEHFTPVDIPYAGSLFTVELLSPSEMVVAGLKGTVLRSQDGGGSWQALDAGSSASLTASSLAANGSLYFVSQAGQVLMLGPRRLTPVSSQPRAALNGILVINPETVVLLSGSGVSTLRLGDEERRP